MKARDFDLRRELCFDADTGVMTFRDSRVLLMDANALGLLRQSLIEEVGFERTKTFLLRVGYQHGYSDFLQVGPNHGFDSELDLLQSGPIVHTLEGLVHAETIEVQFDRERGEFLYRGAWRNSYEAEQHLTFDDVAPEPVCWTLAGYASGWATAFFGSPLVTLETTCVGAGDDLCRWRIEPPAAFGERARAHIDALGQFWSSP